MLALGQEMKNKKLEGRAYAAIGHASRCLDNLERAQACHEKELELALKSQDKKAEARACSSLGNVYQSNGDVDAALKLHRQHLTLSEGKRRSYAIWECGREKDSINIISMLLGGASGRSV